MVQDPSKQAPVSHEEQILSFAVEGTTFGIQLSSLVEVIRMVEVQRVEGSRDLTNGVINYRGTVVPVADLRRGLGLSSLLYGPDANVIISDVAGDRVGLIVDEVRQVLSIPTEDMDPPGAGVPLRKFLSAVAKRGHELVFILDIQSILDHGEGSYDEAPFAKGPTQDEDVGVLLRRRARDLSKPVDEAALLEGLISSTFICFGLGRGLYAVRADYCREIVPPPAVTPIPSSPSFLSGAANIRGAILPVIETSSFLQLGEEARQEDTSECRVLLIEIGEALAGLTVDIVRGIVPLDESQVYPHVSHIEGGVGHFLEGDFDWNGETVCLLSAQGIMDVLTSGSEESM